MASVGARTQEASDADGSIRRPGGRNERVRRDVAEAVLQLFREGRSDFGVAEVADRANVHRSTVYRKWPTVADLVREALTLHTRDLRTPDTGTWSRDIHALADHLARFFSDPVEISMNAALAAGSSPEVDAVMIEHWKPLFNEMSHLVGRAADRSEIPDDTDPILVLYLLVGPLLMQTTFLRMTPSPRFVSRLADSVVAATESGAAHKKRSARRAQAR